MVHRRGEIVSPWGIPLKISMLFVGPWDVIIEHFLSVSMSIIRLVNCCDILSLFIELEIVSLDTESNATLISRERIHSSSLLSLTMLYIKLRIWIGWNVPWFGSPAKLWSWSILYERKILERRLVKILVKIFLYVFKRAIGRVSWMLNFHSNFLLMG